MIKEYIEQLLRENEEVLEQLQKQLKNLIEKLRCSQEWVDKLQSEKSKDINIFSPRSIQMGIDEKLEKAKEDCREIDQQIEGIQGKIDIHTKKKHEYEILLEEWNRMQQNKRNFDQSKQAYKERSVNEEGVMDEESLINEDSLTDGDGSVNKDDSAKAGSSVNEDDLANADSSANEDDSANADSLVYEDGLVNAHSSVNEDDLANADSLVYEDGLANADSSVNEDDLANADSSANEDDSIKADSSVNEDDLANAHSLTNTDSLMNTNSLLNEKGICTEDDNNSEKSAPLEARKVNLQEKSETDAAEKNIDIVKLKKFLDDIYAYTEHSLAFLNGDKNKCKAELQKMRRTIKKYASEIYDSE